MIKCPNCAAQLEFDVKSKSIECNFCGSKFSPKELKTAIKKAKEQENGQNETYEGRSYTCSQCGATLLTFDETAITFCSYCGSQEMIESKMIKRNNPKFIIPFKKTKEDCIKAYKRKISLSLFAPDYMKSDFVVSKFRGIYIPYCVYKLSFHGNCVNKGSKYRYRLGDYKYYDSYKLNAEVDADYNGISYDMRSDFYDKFSQAIPHNYKEAEPFNINYLAGFYADTADVEDHIYEDDARTIAIENTTIRMQRKRIFARYNCLDPKALLYVSKKEIGMFPMYFLAIRDKDNKYVNYAIVNGQTGKVVADLPVDFKKYVLISIILAMIIFLFINNKLVIVPTSICVFSIIASGLSMIISLVQLKRLETYQNHLDDEGYIYTKKIKQRKESWKIRAKRTLKCISKQIAAALLGILVLWVGFVNDIYYYGASIINLSLVIWSFSELIREHNLLVSTKLPQLNKRGGSENE